MRCRPRLMWDGYFSNGQPFTGIIAEHFDPVSVTNYAHGFAEAVNPGPEPLPAALALHLGRNR